MNNNEMIKRLRFILDVDDAAIAECFTLGGCSMTVDGVLAFFKAEDEELYQLCDDAQMTRFLDGLIIFRRGPSKEGLRNPVALTNNIILKKVRIALELEARDLDNAFMLADCELSPHEISSFFRKPGTKHFVACTDEVLERFFSGLSLYFRS
jgi:uncharacterized protein YehS (DUF1456 family)